MNIEKDKIEAMNYLIHISC